jgi:hypothetical protein
MYKFLMLGSLGEMDLKNARAKQVAVHKAKLTARMSLGKGGSMLASVALACKKEKEVKMVGEALKQAKAALSYTENKTKKEVYHLGVADRKDEIERKKWVKEQQALQGCSIAVYIPPEKLVPIRDREKQPTDEEVEAIYIQHQSLYNAVAREQEILEEVLARDLESFSEVPVDPAILTMEEAFRVKQNPLSLVRYTSDSEEEDEDDGYIPSSLLGRMVIRDEEEDMDMCSSPPRSVATIDSFDTRNQDFLRFQ